jgi:hypothetical protein
MTLCFNCDSYPTRPSSHFCSETCKEEFIKTMPFVLECYYCDGNEEGLNTKEAAEAGGWTDIIVDADTGPWNYLGLCPDCQLRLCQPTFIVGENDGER